MNEYKAELIRCIDGDTVDLDINFGMLGLHAVVRCSFARLSAPDVNGQDRDQGLDTKAWLEEYLKGKALLAGIRKRWERNGSYLIELTYWENGLRYSVNDIMTSLNRAQCNPSKH